MDKKKIKRLNESLRFQTNWGAKQIYGEITDDIQALIDQELSWIENSGFTEGFLALKVIADTAKNDFSSPVGADHGILAGSIVAYCLGLIANDPLNTEFQNTTFRPAELTPSLNVSMHFAPEKRNEIVAWASQKYGPSMMRLGVPIIKLPSLILEFHRIMKKP